MEDLPSRVAHIGNHYLSPSMGYAQLAQMLQPACIVPSGYQIAYPAPVLIPTASPVVHASSQMTDL